MRWLAEYFRIWIRIGAQYNTIFISFYHSIYMYWEMETLPNGKWWLSLGGWAVLNKQACFVRIPLPPKQSRVVQKSIIFWHYIKHSRISSSRHLPIASQRSKQVRSNAIVERKNGHAVPTLVDNPPFPLTAQAVNSAILQLHGDVAVSVGQLRWNNNICLLESGTNLISRQYCLANSSAIKIENQPESIYIMWQFGW